MGYSKASIEQRCSDEIIKPEKFYDIPEVKYRGKTTDENFSMYYTEVIAEFLNDDENFARIERIQERDRTSKQDSYNMNHQGKYPEKKDVSDEKYHSREKIIAIDIFNQCKEDGPFDYIGEIIDYQTPLKAEQEDSSGEIDLLAFNKDEKRLYILELKKNKKGTKESPETMLKCILEAYTYYKLVKKETLLKDFGLPAEIIKNIVISPLVFKEDKQYEEWQEMLNGKRPQLKKLIKKLDVEVIPFFLEAKGNNKYKIFKE